MLERNATGKFKCHLPSPEGPRPYDLSLQICTTPTCPCRDVHIEVGDNPEEIVVDVVKKALSSNGDDSSLGRDFVGAMTDDDWRMLADHFWQFKADCAEDVGLRTEPIRVGPKTGRNEPCPCGSGKKYKKCCFATGAAGKS